MIKTLNPYASTAKTAEIMSRYRPIAPKPETPSSPTSETPPPTTTTTSSNTTSQKIRQSPYLRNLWPQLQARPTRTRKRGRAALSPSTTLKRQRTHALGQSPAPSHVAFPANNILQGFTHGLSQLSAPHLLDQKPTNSLVTLPLLPCHPPSTPVVSKHDWIKAFGEENPVIDLNTIAEVPEEKDLLEQLQRLPTGPTTTNVIAPQPIRPVGSIICVGSISEDLTQSLVAQAPKNPEEVEAEVESEVLPVVISDSNNKVRMANSAYKELVGQPECSWLDSMVTSTEGRLGLGGGSCKRIGGEVALQFSDTTVPFSSNGFSCWVRIEWGSDGYKNSVKAFCEVIRISCEPKDYVFTWRFHIHTREASQSSCNV